MAVPRWITSLLLASPLVSWAASAADVTGTVSNHPAVDTSGAPDIASQFVPDLIANATNQVCQAEQVPRPTHNGCSTLLCSSNNSSLVVDLGYAKYRGHHNITTGLNSWKGSEHLPLL